MFLQLRKRMQLLAYNRGRFVIHYHLFSSGIQLEKSLGIQRVNLRIRGQGTLVAQFHLRKMRWKVILPKSQPLRYRIKSVVQIFEVLSLRHTSFLLKLPIVHSESLRRLQIAYQLWKIEHEQRLVSLV